MSQKSFSILRVFGILLLLVMGFFAGVAWKNVESDNDKDSSALTPVKSENPTLAESEKTVTGFEFENPELNPTEKATIALFENAAPSVCFITTSNIRRDFFRMNATEVPAGSGSGFVWSAEGHVITNFHVIQNASRVQVTLSDGESYDAEVIGYAAEKDLAVLKIDAPSRMLKPIPRGNSEGLRVGQSVYAIGNPFGLDQTLTTGIVSALGREIESVSGVPIRDVIQTDAAINPGNSGGPLLDSSGRLIGVNTAIYSPSGASAGIGFSIPVDVVKWVVPELIKYGKIQRPTLGIMSSGGLEQRLGIEGVLVMEVVPNRAAARAGIRPTMRNQYGKIVLGDIIVKIDKNKIKGYNDLILTLEEYKPGDEVEIVVLREDKELKLNLTLDTANN